MTRYSLPDLPYDYGALEPYISGRVMELHHNKHHKAYVDGANKALEQLQESQAKGWLDSVGRLEQVLADWSLPPVALHLVMPPGGLRPVRVNILADFLVRRLAAAPWAK